MSKQPRAVLDGIFAFPPNRETLGGTAYLILEKNANISIDSPPWDETAQEFLLGVGGLRWLFITHRGGIGKAKEIQLATGCEIVIQEQIAYLLPKVQVTTFRQEYSFGSTYKAIWTPGHCQGSSCLYYLGRGTAGEGVLFSGRHLLPNQKGEPAPLRSSKTFHWPRQIRSVRALLDQFSPETLNYICPGANTGFLRGERSIDQAYSRLASLDLDACLDAKVLL